MVTQQGQQPVYIDNLKFASHQEYLKGSLPQHSLSRLMEYLSLQAASSQNHQKNPGIVEYELTGKLDPMGRHFLHLNLTAKIQTCCQRCLQDMLLDLQLEFDYLVTDAGESEPDVDESDEYDLLEPEQAMNLNDLIEDELILALPIAPLHPHDCSPGKMQSGEKPNPFAVLKGLIKS